MLPVQRCDRDMRKRFRGELSEEFAQVIQDHVEVFSNDKYVIFDKTPARVSTKPMHVCLIKAEFPFQILMKDIHIPETIGTKAISYPPRILIRARATSDFTSPKIHVEGLDRECGFNLFIPDSSKYV